MSEIDNANFIEKDKCYLVYDDFGDFRGVVLTADVSPVTHGYWKGKPIAGYCTVRCSVCGSAFLDNDGRWNYCPNCGTRMDEMYERKG